MYITDTSKYDMAKTLADLLLYFLREVILLYLSTLNIYESVISMF